MAYTRIAVGKSRPFEISGGLVEGYGDGPDHDIQDVIDLHHSWQRHHKTILGVRIARCTISYGWTADGEDRIMAHSEPGFILSGGINVLYAADMNDAQANDIIVSLAAHLADGLKQTRIYITWNGEDKIFERD